MTLTSAQESRLLAKYDPYIRKHVHTYLRGKPWNAHCYDDLYQEARLEFLILIRKLGSEEELVLRAPCRLRGAMMDYCRQMALVSIPHNAYKAHAGDYTRCAEDVLDMENALPCARGDDFEILLREGMAALPERERITILLVMSGYSNREAMPIVGVKSDAAMTRLLQKGRARLAPYLFDTKSEAHS